MSFSGYYGLYSLCDFFGLGSITKRIPVQSSRDFGTSEPVWIPSPHIITTNKHHSRNSYCACCHGRPNQNHVLCNAYIKSDALTIDHATSPQHDASPSYASKIMPRLRPKWKLGASSRCVSDERPGRLEASVSVGYVSQTLPIRQKKISKHLEYGNGESLTRCYAHPVDMF